LPPDQQTDPAVKRIVTWADFLVGVSVDPGL
jgi:hypothetical protein